MCNLAAKIRIFHETSKGTAQKYLVCAIFFIANVYHDRHFWYFLKNIGDTINSLSRLPGDKEVYGFSMRRGEK